METNVKSFFKHFVSLATLFMIQLYIHIKKKYLYKNLDSKYITTSSQTSFEINLLSWFDINIVCNQISFSGFSEAYNIFHNPNKDVIHFGSLKFEAYFNLLWYRTLDRRRLSEGWFTWKLRTSLIKLNSSYDSIDYFQPK
jgi:hypothetical protein